MDSCPSHQRHCVNRPDGVGPSLLTTRAADAEWRVLLAALTRTFEESTDVTPEHAAGQCLRDADHARLCKELRGLGRWEPGCYTRTTLAQSELFVALLLCWSPAVTSPVHAHSDEETNVKSSCFMRILEGTLVETLYEPSAIIDESRVMAAAGKRTHLGAGGYKYINDHQGVHKVGNESTSEGAMSLHIYAPGWKVVGLYDEYVEPPASDAGGAELNMDAWGDF